MKTGFSLYGNTTQENPVLALYGIAVHVNLKLEMISTLNLIVERKNFLEKTQMIL